MIGDAMMLTTRRPNPVTATIIRRPEGKPTSKIAPLAYGREVGYRHSRSSD